jgi:phosphate-selective porin OprO/OprP
VRYSALDLNDNGINGGVMQAGTLGLNWFMNPNAKMQFTYDLAHRGQVRETAPGYINSYGIRLSYDF